MLLSYSIATGFLLLLVCIPSSELYLLAAVGVNSSVAAPGSLQLRAFVYQLSPSSDHDLELV